MKLKELLKAKVDEESCRLAARLAAQNELSDDEIARQQDLIKIVFEDLDEVYASFKTLSDDRNVVFSDEFYPTLREVLLFKPYFLYDCREVRDDVTEAELEPFAAAIEDGNLNACKEFLEADKKFQSLDYALFQNFNGLLTNLYHVLRGLVHRAKHFNSFAAGERFLRALSLARRFARHFDRITPADVDELVDCLERGFEELVIATDYASIGTWEDYLAKEYLRPEAK